MERRKRTEVKRIDRFGDEIIVEYTEPTFVNFEVKGEYSLAIWGDKYTYNERTEMYVVYLKGMTTSFIHRPLKIEIRLQENKS